MELPTSASVTEMRAGLVIQANVTEVESAFGQLGLSPTSMLDADMFEHAVNFVIPPRGSVLRVNVVKYSTDWYDLWLEGYCAAESCSYVYMVRVFFWETSVLAISLRSLDQNPFATVWARKGGSWALTGASGKLRTGAASERYARLAIKSVPRYSDIWLFATTLRTRSLSSP